jgi:hypothetical protein
VRSAEGITNYLPTSKIFILLANEMQIIRGSDILNYGGTLIMQSEKRGIG